MFSLFPASHRIGALQPQEIDELDKFLMSDTTSNETMMLDTLDGYLTAIVIGPKPAPVSQWLPRVWGPDATHAPDFESEDQARHITTLLIRHLNGIALQFMRDPAGFEPLFNVSTYQDSEQEFIDGEMWAYGFMQGVALNLAEWRPLIHDPLGKTVFHPIYLLGADSVTPPEEDDTRTPAQREVIAKSIPTAVKTIHEFWRPYRDRDHSPSLVTPINRSQPKVGRNDPCPCGSGKKYKKCCGGTVLH